MKIAGDTIQGVGIRAEPAALKQRLVVWEGLQLIPREIAVEQGYYEPADNEPGVIVPKGDARFPTDEEVMQITATPNTKRTMQLLQVPKAIGEVMLTGSCQYGSHFNENNPNHLIAPHIKGQYMHMREDQGNQLTLTCNPEASHRSGLPPKVGFHIDNWENPELMITVGNAGPGPRLHCIVPDFNREAVGGALPIQRAAFFGKSNELAMKVLGIRIDPPTEHFLELLTSPVAQYLHDGSTWGFAEPTTGFFSAVDPIPFDAYPSPLMR